MKKYISPTIEIVETEASDIVTASGDPVSYEALEGVDKEGDVSAIFSANFWFRG